MMQEEFSVGDLLGYKAVFRAMAVPMVVLDSDLHFVDCTDEYAITVAQKREDMIGRYIFDVFPDHFENSAAVIAAMKSALGGDPAVLRDQYYPVDTDHSGAPNEIWWDIYTTPIPRDGTASGYITVRAEDATERHVARRKSDTISTELQHRLKNAISLIGVIAKQTFATVDPRGEHTSKFQARLKALSDANAILSDGRRRTVELDTLVQRGLDPYAPQAKFEMSIAGPAVWLDDDTAQSISMAIHELATNAAKYGALGKDGCELDVSWTLDGAGACTFVWRETCGHPLTPNDTAGFGTRLLMDLLPTQVDGTAERTFDGGTFLYRLCFARTGHRTHGD